MFSFNLFSIFSTFCYTDNLHAKTEYVKQIRNLKQALNHGLILKKVHSH